jgi:hypothetical protein
MYLQDFLQYIPFVWNFTPEPDWTEAFQSKTQSTGPTQKSVPEAYLPAFIVMSEHW